MNQVISPVDYDAWNKGYMPPTEHILIHKLQFERTKVVLSTMVSRDNQMWVVIEGPPLSRNARKAIRSLVAFWFEDEAIPSFEGMEEYGPFIPVTK